MIALTRETVALLLAAGYGILPTLVQHDAPERAWRMSEALREAETALLADQREATDQEAQGVLS